MRFSPRFLGICVTAMGAAMVAAALLFQHIGGLSPCILCIYQRWPWVVAAMLGLVAIAVARPAGVSTLALWLAAAALLTGAGIAAFHVGVEQQWWAGTAECGAAGGRAKSIDELREQLMATKVTRCDEVAWSLAGISMAGWNMLLSLAMAAFLTWSLAQQRGRVK